MRLQYNIMLTAIVYLLLVYFAIADNEASSSNVEGELQKGEKFNAKSFLLRGGSPGVKENMLALESLRDFASNHLMNINTLQRALREGDSTGFISALKTTLEYDADAVLQVSNEEDKGILEELTRELDLDSNAAVLSSSIDTFLEDSSNRDDFVDFFQSQSGRLKDMSEMGEGLVNALDKVTSFNRRLGEDHTNLFSRDKFQGSSFEFDNMNGGYHKFGDAQTKGNWQDWQQNYHQNFMRQRHKKGRGKFTRRRGSFPDITSFLHRGDKTYGDRRLMEVKDRHNARRTALNEDNQCIPKCLPSDWECNCQNLFKCVNVMSDYDAVMLLSEGYVDTDANSNSYANYTVDPDELDVFIAAEGISKWLGDLKDLAKQDPSQSTCSLALNKVYSTCPFGQECTSPNDRTHHLSVEDVCNSINHDHKLYFEAMYDAFDKSHDPSSEPYCGSTAYASCAQFAIAMEKIYDARDKVAYPAENPLKRGNGFTGIDQGNRVYQYIHFPYEYVYSQSDEGIKTIIFPTPNTSMENTEDLTCDDDTSCPDQLCCSQYNYCGVGEAYCGAGCKSNCGGPWTPTKRPGPECNFEKYYSEPSSSFLDPIQIVSKEDGRVLKATSCNGQFNGQLVASEVRSCDAGTVWYHDSKGERIYSALCQGRVIEGTMLNGRQLFGVGSYDINPSSYPQAFIVKPNGRIQLVDDQEEYICSQPSISGDETGFWNRVTSCDDSSDFDTYAKDWSLEVPTQDPYKFFVSPPVTLPDFGFPGIFSDDPTYQLFGKPVWGDMPGDCLTSQYNTTLAEEGMAMCDRSMKFLLGNLMSLGALQAISDDIEENGPLRMPGRCCLDSSTTSEWFGQSYDPQEGMQCLLRGPWYLGLSKDVCEFADGVWERAPCYRLQECINNRPKNGTAGYSQSFETWSQQLVIEDPNNEDQCGNSRNLLGYDVDYPFDSEVCQTFEDDLCDPFFDSLDSMSPPGPEWKNVSYDPVQYDSGDVPFDPLPELDDWQDAATFGSYDDWGPGREWVLYLENTKVAFDSGWRTFKLDQKACNAIPLVSEECWLGSVTIGNIYLAFFLVATAAFQIAKHIFESHKIGAGDVWNTWFYTESTNANMKNFNAWMYNSTITINKNIHLQHEYMLNLTQVTHQSLTNTLTKEIEDSTNELGYTLTKEIADSTNELGCSIAKAWGGTCISNPLQGERNPPRISMKVEWPENHETLWSKINSIQESVMSLQSMLDNNEVIARPKMKNGKQKKSKQEKEKQYGNNSRLMMESGVDIVGAVKAVRSAVEVVEAKMEEKVKGVEARMDSIEGKVDALNDAVEEKVKGVEARMDSIEGKVDALMIMMSKLVDQKDA